MNKQEYINRFTYNAHKKIGDCLGCAFDGNIRCKSIYLSTLFDKPSFILGQCIHFKAANKPPKTEES